jgi:hypothetical protein
MNRVILSLATFVLAVQGVTAAAQTTHALKTVESMFTSDGATPCLTFKLVGVTIADPAVQTSNRALFAVPKSQANFAEIYAMLLAAKASALPVTVFTTGTTQCGAGAGVSTLGLQPTP